MKEKISSLGNGNISKVVQPVGLLVKESASSEVISFLLYNMKKRSDKLGH